LSINRKLNSTTLDSKTSHTSCLFIFEGVVCVILPLLWMLSSLRTPIAERPPHCLYNYSWVRGCWSLLARLSQSPGYSICCWELGPLPPVSEQTAALSYTCTSAASPGEAGILGRDTIEPPDSVSFKILTAASRCGIKILFHRIKIRSQCLAHISGFGIL
jgi:hypothetical protein